MSCRGCSYIFLLHLLAAARGLEPLPGFCGCHQWPPFGRWLRNTPMFSPINDAAVPEADCPSPSPTSPSPSCGPRAVTVTFCGAAVPAGGAGNRELPWLRALRFVAVVSLGRPPRCSPRNSRGFHTVRTVPVPFSLPAADLEDAALRRSRVRWAQLCVCERRGLFQQCLELFSSS